VGTIHVGTFGRAMVTLADTLSHHDDTHGFLDRLAHRCVDVLGCDASGVLLTAKDGTLQVAVATTPAYRAIEEVQARCQEGPCVTAWQTDEAVVVRDLPRVAPERWPAYATEAAATTGLPAATIACPLRWQDHDIGALNLYWLREWVVDAEHELVEAARALADIAAVGVVNAQRHRDAEELADQLQRALDSRVRVEQAKGVLAEAYAMTPDEAFDRVRAYARANNLRLDQVVHRVIYEGLRPRP
jgi:transcriptional regulator with GAF, ATPase, and Fis domain